MITIRKSNERGTTQIDWLDSKHTFSFGDYYDHAHTHFRALRVINEDVVSPGRGFDLHSHNNMEIITVVISGTVSHEDSMGNKKSITPGEIQVMSAGKGVTHSEYNNEKTPLHLLQIWIEPNRRNLSPAYSQARIATKTGLTLLASEEGPLNIRQNALVYFGKLNAKTSHEHTLKNNRGAWVQVISGTLSTDGKTLSAGDGAAIEKQDTFTLTTKKNAEFLLFDLP